MTEHNIFKNALNAGKKQIGIWSNLGSSLAVEVVGGAGFDWVVLDAEHGPNELTDILVQLQAISRYDVEPMVRIPVNDKVIVKKYLDIGVRTFLVPFVENADEARDAVAATRYPPYGVRGVSVGNRANRFGRVKDYLQTAHESICICAQIETATAIRNLPEIIAVDGIDAVFIGPSDLAASLGHLGDSGHSDVQAAIDNVLSICNHAGKPAGILAGSDEDIRRFYSNGFSYVAVGSDLGLLARGSEVLREKYRDIVA